ncbi:Replication termination protein [Scopulibacillus cellulosilyticus]|uniref:Replication termination protein n=1 Tax=Scopulibacillus cellulosilyticus TaxID=2665665 RepID=A0ABW2PUQ5_9BACL
MANRFLTKQRAVLKLYLINLVEQDRLYGLQFLQLLRKEFEPYGFRPTHSEIYKSLHELTKEGILFRTKKLKGEGQDGFQEIVIYQFTEGGYEKAKAYKKLVKQDLDRSQQMINKILRDNY